MSGNHRWDENMIYLFESEPGAQTQSRGNLFERCKKSHFFRD